MRVAITGAFGFLGANFLRAGRTEGFLSPSDEIVAFHSRTREHPLLDGFAYRSVHLDVSDANDLTAKTRGVDLLVHFAGKVAYARADAAAAWRINVGGTAAVLEAVRRNNIPRAVLVSSIAALGATSAGRLGDEANDPYTPATPIAFRSREETLAALTSAERGDYRFFRRFRSVYFETKLAALELARAAIRREGLPIVTIFPGTTVGAGDVHYAIAELVDKVWTGRLLATLPGETSFVHAADFAEGAWLAALRGAPGDEFVISGRDADNLRFGDFMALIARTAHTAGGRRVRQRFLTVPHGPAVIAGALAEALGGGGSFSAGLVRAGAGSLRYTSARAAERLGYQPRRSLADGILACRRFSEARRDRR